MITDMQVASASELGLVKVAAVSPRLNLANVEANVRAIGDAMHLASRERCAIVAFPELSLTGHSCGDLFFQTRLLKAVVAGLERLAKLTCELDLVVIVGAPLMIQQRLYNCAVVLGNGKILGVVPKTHLPNTQEFYEKRWFHSANDLPQNFIDLAGTQIPCGNDLIFEDANNDLIAFGVEICEDLWVAEPPSGQLALAGAQMIFNLSASDETVGKTQYRRDLVRMQSARTLSAYIYAGAGWGESTTDIVYAGECFVAQNNVMLAGTGKFATDRAVAFAQIDVELLAHARRNATDQSSKKPFRRVKFSLAGTHDMPAEIFGKISKTPFIDHDAQIFDAHCREAFEIQVAGLARRIEHTRAKCVVLGISGGLDSTLAILVAKAAFEKLGRDPKEIIGISLPGLGTSERTRGNALGLMKRLGISAREISIVPAVTQHFGDIGHDENVFDVTYENSQARERTQVLMDVAGKHGGFVVGTGDLSEAALGWCTFNGDHVSMYHVNIGVPKTFIRHIVAWVAKERGDPEIARILTDIIDTPISPELKPVNAQGEIAQKTEDLVGPYELHDFFLYHFCGNGFSPNKIRFLARNAFAGDYDGATIDKWLRVFFKRFFAQQFKRSVCPDGPKVFSVSLSPRGDWRMPSDAQADTWIF